jgi:phage pi2 protein 07
VNNPVVPRSDITVADSASTPIMAPFEWQNTIEGKHCPNLKKLCRDSYTSDKMFHKILEHPDNHKIFEVDNNLIYYSPNSET